jgi:5-methyltetrahydropteroyltriglutamate--homocysteine methyltransferase
MTSPVLRAYQHGVYPRSERLVQATRDVERGRTTGEAVDRAFEDERTSFIQLQRRVELDYISDGLLRWHDVFRPLATSSTGLDARSLVRWFDNNSFFRAPAVSATPRLGDLPDWVLHDGIPQPKVASLPSPFLFSRAADAAGDRDDLMIGLARDVLAPAAARLVSEGFELLHLEEPWLPYFGIDDASWSPLERALQSIREAAPDGTLVLHCYYADASEHADRLRRLPVNAVGIDFVETDLEALPAPWETGLVAGVIDGRRSVLESPAEIVGFVRRIRERLEPTTLFLSSGSELELAGPEVAPRKVEVLGEAARLLREDEAA